MHRRRDTIAGRMLLHLVDLNDTLVDAWRAAFAGMTAHRYTVVHTPALHSTVTFVVLPIQVWRPSSVSSVS